MGFLSGKKVLVTGLISNRSIAWGIASQLAAQGADPGTGNPQQVAAFIRSEVAKFAKVVAESGAKPE